MVVGAGFGCFEPCRAGAGPSSASSAEAAGSPAQKVAAKVNESYCYPEADTASRMQCEDITGYDVDGDVITVKTRQYPKDENKPDAETIARFVSGSVGCGSHVGIGSYSVRVEASSGDELAMYKPPEAVSTDC